ncbi:Panacea domain-containing protein [Parabacteroides goldsteinii]|uniref:DUF4065 domain-containing protein n=2 Tax=Bacteroidales TaxID=171549 RepID=A0A6G1ZDV3_9BACT|nr:type II toxin-antitoxin system antitoxin SocA domain-containing protein [Parabacteroides goldsteinii]KAA5199673.1 DUF4065 domain-containing protein [Bacteroides fragilis]MRX93433.1 DUF4065 domain-containing protein [Parabacteroides goldsteinii]MRX95944.1 DUF4065 domain-containing protein [Parabacteroides goldsteinii]MRY05150.1 DUF4065 domain-containing protein [Parabacteroides goldsteinii]MRY12050.1 DUF4065 domain-containing protein [Parabacteroides goldsteinii]
MKTNALAVANYLVAYAKEQGKPLKLLGLMKRVYIVHGFSLAIYDKSILDERFDQVEAWKYGPVIPSVYHSFKYNRDKEIVELTDMLVENEKGFSFETPTLEDCDIKKICEMVWKRYEDVTDSQMVELTHRKGTPWNLCYVPGMNTKIPDELTKLHYKNIIKATLTNS